MKSLDLSNKTDYQKVKAIYDYICSNVTYDHDNLNDESYSLKYTAYAALINKTAVCQGYASLFYRLALDAGVDTSGIETPDAWQGYTQDNYQYNYNDGSNDYWYDGGNSWDNSWNGGYDDNTYVEPTPTPEPTPAPTPEPTPDPTPGTGSSARADTNTRSGTGFNTNSGSRWRRRKQCRRNNRKCKLEKNSGLCRGFSSDK